MPGHFQRLEVSVESIFYPSKIPELKIKIFKDGQEYTITRINVRDDDFKSFFDRAWDITKQQIDKALKEDNGQGAST